MYTEIIFREILKDLQITEKMRILLCGVSFDLEKLVKELVTLTSDIEIVYLHELKFDLFLKACEVPLAVQYDIIFAFDLLEEMDWDSKLIRALGIHLKDQGSLYYCFGLKTPLQEFLTIHNLMYANWFQSNKLQQIAGTEYVMGCSTCFQREVVWLQEQYPAQVRFALSYLLQRIEYGIDRAENLQRLLSLCSEYQIDAAYLKRFVQSATLHGDAIWRVLQGAKEGTGYWGGES